MDGEDKATAVFTFTYAPLLQSSGCHPWSIGLGSTQSFHAGLSLPNQTFGIYRLAVNALGSR